jgi:hypothetical protein
MIGIFVAEAARLFAQNVSPRLEISTPNNQSTFYLGERIPIKLNFTGPEDGSYAVELTNYGIPTESYAVVPSSGWAPPLDAYDLFSLSGVGSFSRGGSALSSKAVIVDADLNESVRFDEPGVYTLTISSPRVGHASKNRIFPTDSVALISNTLELHIIAATPEWQQSTLNRIQLELAKPQQTSYNPSPEWRAALEDLRYLDSPEAIALLAANIRDDSLEAPRPAYLGLVGLPRLRRDTALAAMNHLIDDPSFPVSSGFIDTMGWLKTGPPVLVVVDPGSERSPVRVDHKYVLPTQQEYEAFKAKQQTQKDAIWEIVAAALPHKTGTARAATAQALVANSPSAPTPSAQAHLGAALRASFPGLKDYEKTTLLNQYWDSISSRELLPQLKELAKQPVNRETNQFQVGSSGSLTAAALARWYEFEPESATLEVLRQLNTPTPTLSAKDLYFLSGQTFPQFERLWVQGFAKGDITTDYEPAAASLLIHFGTGTVSRQMAAIARAPSSDYACNRPAEALAYLVRFDSEEAKRLLNSPAMMADSQGFSCGIGLLDFIASQIGDPTPDPMLMEAALAALHQPNTRNTSGIINFLIYYGDNSARQPILDLYLKWAERWSTHPEEPAQDAPREQREDRELGQTLVAALLANQGWIADESLKATVREHCIGKNLCDEVDRLSKPNFDVTVFDTSDFDTSAFEIGPFRSHTLKLFEAKIDQFPKGTTFHLIHDGNSNSQALQNKAEAGVADLFAKHGMKLAVTEH